MRFKSRLNDKAESDQHECLKRMFRGHIPCPTLISQATLVRGAPGENQHKPPAWPGQHELNSVKQAHTRCQSRQEVFFFDCTTVHKCNPKRSRIPSWSNCMATFELYPWLITMEDYRPKPIYRVCVPWPIRKVEKQCICRSLLPKPPLLRLKNLSVPMEPLARLSYQKKGMFDLKLSDRSSFGSKFRER